MYETNFVAVFKANKPQETVQIGHNHLQEVTMTLQCNLGLASPHMQHGTCNVDGTVQMEMKSTIQLIQELLKQSRHTVSFPLGSCCCVCNGFNSN